MSEKIIEIHTKKLLNYFKQKLKADLQAPWANESD